MNIFDMNKNSLPEQVQINKDNIKYLLEHASEFSCVLRAALAQTFNIDNNYNTGDLVWHNDGTVELPENYLYKANQAVSAGIWDETQWDVVKLKDLLDEKQNTLTFDDDPTLNSDNPVKSSGIYNALLLKQDKLSYAHDEQSITASTSYANTGVTIPIKKGINIMTASALYTNNTPKAIGIHTENNAVYCRSYFETSKVFASITATYLIYSDVDTNYYIFAQYDGTNANTIKYEIIYGGEV